MEDKAEGKGEKSFQSFGKQVDGFVSEFQEAAEKMEVEFKQKFEELKVAADRVKKEAENKERWKEVEENLRKAADEVSRAFRAAFRKRDP